MKTEFKCACGQPEWIVVQTSLQEGYVHCIRCDTRLRFEIVTIEYTA